jgi:phage-related tail protein
MPEDLESAIRNAAHDYYNSMTNWSLRAAAMQKAINNLQENYAILYEENRKLKEKLKSFEDMMQATRDFIKNFGS